MYYCFPHYFVLPMYSSATSYRFRPPGPEETLMEIWSLTRYPQGQEPGPPTPPIPRSFDDERIPPIPTPDFSNLPRQQRGLHNAGFEYMRLAEGIEGGIANFERTLDGFLAGRPYDQLEAALRAVNVTPSSSPSSISGSEQSSVRALHPEGSDPVGVGPDRPDRRCKKWWTVASERETRKEPK